MPRLRTSAGRRAPRRQPSPSPPRGRGVGDASIDGVVDMDISDVESSESEEAGGNREIIDIPIDDVDSDEADRRATVAALSVGIVDIPIEDIESEEAGGNGDIVDVPIDDIDSDEADRRAALATRADVYSVIDIPIPDVESSSDAGDTKARRGGTAARETQAGRPAAGEPRRNVTDAPERGRRRKNLAEKRGRNL